MRSYIHKRRQFGHVQEGTKGTMDRITNLIVPLNEKNYPTWKLQVKMSLIKDDLFKIVDGSEVAPTEANQLAKFNTRKDRALAIIVLSVEPKLLYLLGDPNDPAEVWKKLGDVFQKKTWSNKLRLKKKLYSLQLKPDDDLQSHLKSLIEVFDELSVIGDALKEEDRVICLLASLPDKFSTIVTALEASESVPKWDSVVERLLHQETKFNERSSENASENKVLFSKKNKFNFNGKRKCFECGSPHHIRRNCSQYSEKQKQGNTDKQNSQIKGKSHVASNDSEDVILYAQNFSVMNDSSKSCLWIIDSGCTQHMCNDKTMFCEYSDEKSSGKVEIGDGSALSIEGKGTVKLKMNTSDENVTCYLKNVLFIPDLVHNLISVSQCTENNKKVIFYDDCCKIFTSDNNKLIAQGKRFGKLFILDCETQNSVHIASDKSKQSLWHRRFCHIGMKNLQKIYEKSLVLGIDCKIDYSKDVVCEHCANGKNHRTPFPLHDVSKPRRPFELIHSDVCGKIEPVTFGGGLYFVTFIDDATRYCWTYVINSKDKVFEVFKEWKTMVERQYNAKIKMFRSDNGGEYTSNEFELYFKNEGIIHQKSIPKTPEQNGLAERKNRSLVESIRCMISDSGVSKQFWGEALSTANYVINRSPSSALGDKTPFEALHNRKPSVKHFKVFGAKAYAHIPKDERTKLDMKSRQAIFVGYGTNVKGYRLYDLDKKKIFFSRDIIFDENFRSKPVQQIVNDENLQSPIPEMNIKEDSEEESEENEEYASANSEEDVRPSPDVRRSKRTSRPPERYGDFASIAGLNNPVPTSVEQAIAGPEASQWLSAMQLEMDSMRKNDVWKIVKIPPNANILKCKWVFSKKLDTVSNCILFKARLVARGYSQKYGLDYFETFSPVVRFESIRTILSLAAKRKLMVHHLDVKTAFLNSDLDENIYMHQPEQFVTHDDKKYVCKLNRSIYGLKQSSMQWNTTFDKYLKELNFESSKNDGCVYTYFQNDITCIIALYVDDLLIACDSSQFLDDIKLKLSNKFDIKDLGEVKRFLGVDVDFEVGKIFINQSTFIDDLLEKFNFSNAKPVSTPVDVSQKLSKTGVNDELCNIDDYQSAVGALLYLATRSRPDIAYSVSTVSKYSSNPSKSHWQAVKRIFRYLKGTKELGILYFSGDDEKCVGFSDADFAGDLDDRKSTSGFCFLYNNGVISWKSCKQTCVALSTAEAEFVSMSAASQESVWLQKLLSDFHIDNVPMLLYGDNQAALSMSKDNRQHGRGKHIDIKYQYIKDMISKGNIVVDYCPSSEMTADIFTKGLPSECFSKLRSALGMCYNS